MCFFYHTFTVVSRIVYSWLHHIHDTCSSQLMSDKFTNSLFEVHQPDFAVVYLYLNQYQYFTIGIYIYQHYTHKYSISPVSVISVSVLY